MCKEEKFKEVTYEQKSIKVFVRHEHAQHWLQVQYVRIHDRKTADNKQTM